MNQYTVGQVIRFSIAVTNLAGDPVDAASATIFIEAPGGAVTSFPMSHPGLGSYFYDYEPTLTRVHSIRIVTINPDSAVETQVNMISAFAP